VISRLMGRELAEFAFGHTTRCCISSESLVVDPSRHSTWIVARTRVRVVHVAWCGSIWRGSIRGGPRHRLRPGLLSRHLRRRRASSDAETNAKSKGVDQNSSHKKSSL